MWVEVELDEQVAGVLLRLGIRHEVVRPWVMRVWMDDEADGALERLVGVLAGLRWRYEEGRELQLELPGLGSHGEGSHGGLPLQVEGGPG